MRVGAKRIRPWVVAFGAVIAAALFLSLLPAMLHTFYRIGLGPHGLLYEDHVTFTAWVVSVVAASFVVRRRIRGAGWLEVASAAVLGSDLGHTIWLTLWLPRAHPWDGPIRALAIALIGFPLALLAASLGAFGTLLADLRPESRRQWG
jgi:hypothetical protein